MPVYCLDRTVIRNRDMVRLDAHQLAVLLVGIVDGLVATPAAALVEQPEVGERGREGGGDVEVVPALEPGHQVVEQHEDDGRVGRQQGVEDHGAVVLFFYIYIYISHEGGLRWLGKGPHRASGQRAQRTARPDERRDRYMYAEIPEGETRRSRGSGCRLGMWRRQRPAPSDGSPERSLQTCRDTRRLGFPASRCQRPRSAAFGCVFGIWLDVSRWLVRR